MRERRLVLLPFTVLSVVLVTMAVPSAWAQVSCASYSPPLLFDTSDNPMGTPWNPRAIGVRVWNRNGSEYLIANVGNELKLWNVDDPENPGVPEQSNFDVPPFGDRDYNLFGMDVCDECRFGIAGFDAQGAVLFDLGQGAPTFAHMQYYPDAPAIGGLTFMLDGIEYLVANNLPGGCSGSPTLWRIWGVHDGEREVVDCLSAAGQAIGIDGGYRLSDATGDYLVIADQTRQGYLFRIDPGPALTYTGTWFYAPTATGHGLAFDNGLLASAFGTVRLYNVSAGLASPQLVAEWQPETAHTVSLVALAYPYLWVAVTAGNLYTYEVTDPTSPNLVDVSFWDPAQPWNSYPYSMNRDAAFTSDGRWLFLARFSVLQRFRVTQDCMQYTVIFADGFESADPSAWSVAVP